MSSHNLALFLYRSKIVDFCNTLPEILTQGTGVEFYVDDVEHKFVYCGIPKVGTSTWLFHLR